MSDKIVIRSLEDLAKIDLGRRMSLAEYGALLDGDIKDAEIEKLRAELDRTHKQLNAAVTLLAEWCHAVDGGGSWDNWDNHYKEARWGKGILRSLIDAEIAKLEPLEDEP